MLGLETCIPSAGTASATSNPPDRHAASTGRRSTRSTSAAQKRESPSVRMRGSRGMRPRSIRGPSSCNTAGNTVTDPAIAQTTTAIVPLAIPLKMLDPIANCPAIAIATVVPAISTVRPDVRAVRASASWVERPRRRSSRERTT